MNASTSPHTRTLHGTLMHGSACANAPAVISPAGTLTFGELAARSQALAERMARFACPAEALVAASLPRSQALAIGWLATLKAGLAFLPLDAFDTTQRSAHIVADARAQLMLRHSSQLDDFELSRLPSAAADVAPSVHFGSSASLREATPGDLAYVIYTSGSTGTPKGVEITHAAAMNTIHHVNQICSVTAQDRILNVSPVNFDLTIYDLFGAWCAGAAVVLPPPAAHPEPAEWIQWMSEGKVSIWNSVPALLSMLLDAVEARRASRCLEHLRVVMLSGDRIAPQLIARITRAKPDVRVLAMGGATEASIWSVHHWAHELSPDTAYVPYGRALPNQSIHVLDEALREVPVGEVGALYIGGAGLARGYRGRPDLNAVSFIHDPSDPAARLYATGDRVRRLSEGNTQFIGREDRQVKVNGYRVEFAEIERALLELEGIAQAWVCSEPASGGPMLVAHLMASADASVPPLVRVRTHLAGALPAHMIPAHFHVHAQLPLTANGKVDLAALQSAARDALLRPPPQPIEQAPEDETRLGMVVLDIWREVLDFPQLLATDHFLDAGGNSVHASQIVNRILERLDIELALSDIFECSSVAELTARVRHIWARRGVLIEV